MHEQRFPSALSNGGKDGYVLTTAARPTDAVAPLRARVATAAGGWPRTPNAASASRTEAAAPGKYRKVAT